MAFLWKHNKTTSPAPQHAAYTNLALAPLPWPGVFRYVMCSLSNSKRMGHLEDQCQKTGTVVWGDEMLSVCDLRLLGGDSRGLSLYSWCQPKYQWLRWHLPTCSWAGPNEEAELAAGGMGGTVCHCCLKHSVLGDGGPRQLTEVAQEASAEQKMKLRFLRLLLPDPLPHPRVSPLVFINSWAWVSSNSRTVSLAVS